MGTLAICLGSHRWREIIDTYGQDDVDRNVTAGIFTHDPMELVDRFGGRWATTTFEPGDAIIVSMYLLHASLGNLTNRYRISCDTRYQRASHPKDERWDGPNPVGHPVMWAPGVQLEPVEVARQRWGI
jgi:ectoine hydroxylase-related dioxygenase (phytanoyl-CoA dioxygenase family)